MADKSEMIGKLEDRIVFVEVTMSVVIALLSQIRNMVEYKLKSDVKRKTN